MKVKSFLINLGDFVYYGKLKQELKGMNSVLDLGCGRESPLAKIKKTFTSMGVDIFPRCLQESKKRKIHDQYLMIDVLKVDQFLKKKSFDAVIALDLIEHLKKEPGINFLKKIEKLAKKKVIILTPNGFTHQDPALGNPHQIHQSGWIAEELKSLGFRVYGLRGFKFIRGEWATIKYQPWFFWGIISFISQFMVYNLPQFAYQLLAVKNLKNEN